jgi:hypothetical protein
MALVHGIKPIVTSGLVLCLDAANRKSYPGIGTAWTDLSGNGNTGTLTNMEVPGDYSTTNGGALTFDGVDEFVQINNPTTFHNQNFTISVWINPGVQDSNLISLMDFDHTAFFHGWVIQSENATGNRNYYLAWGTGGQFQPAGGFGNNIGIQITTSVWQNIVYSKNGTSLLGYSNGSQVFTPPTAGNSFVNYQSNKNVTIAKSTNNAGREFNGSISQVSIYNRALTATEIAQNYNALKSRYI